MKKYLHSFIESLLRIKRYLKYSRHFRKLMRMQHIDNILSKGENEYVAFWKQLSPRVEIYSYRFFRHYCGDSRFIVPEDLGHSFIESSLNPKRYTSFYEDKNMLPVLLPSGTVPATLLCRINGSNILDGNRLKSAIGWDATAEHLFARMGGGKIILKPSIDSSSGRRVMMFYPQNNKYVTQDNMVLDGRFLYEYGADWVLQEAVKQHPYISRFCSSSVNTIRINTYRSVEDEQVYILSAAIRIGHEGSVVDNLHAGGGFVGIDVETGEMKHEVLDQYGNRTTSLNGIDFADETFTIPDWVKIKEFSRNVAALNLHCRLIALDVALKDDGNPILIEWNVTPYSFSYWIPMMTGVTPFGDKTEEIVKYCMKNRK